MSRYIDADALIEKWLPERGELYTVSEIVDSIINEAPTADVVKVVRCKDCLHNGFNCGYTENWCMFYGYDIEKDDYCSYGERKEDGKVH